VCRMEAGHVDKQQLRILAKPPNRRSPEDLNKLVTSFKEVAVFKTLEHAVRTQVCRGLVLEHFPTDTTIFKEGDPGDKFYIILSGSVGIFIKEVGAEDVDKEESEEEGDKEVVAAVDDADPSEAAVKKERGSFTVGSERRRRALLVHSETLALAVAGTPKSACSSTKNPRAARTVGSFSTHDTTLKCLKISMKRETGLDETEEWLASAPSPRYAPLPSQGVMSCGLPRSVKNDANTVCSNQANSKSLKKGKSIEFAATEPKDETGSEAYDDPKLPRASLNRRSALKEFGKRNSVSLEPAGTFARKNSETRRDSKMLDEQAIDGNVVITPRDAASASSSSSSGSDFHSDEEEEEEEPVVRFSSVVRRDSLQDGHRRLSCPDDIAQKNIADIQYFKEHKKTEEECGEQESLFKKFILERRSRFFMRQDSVGFKFLHRQLLEWAPPEPMTYHGSDSESMSHSSEDTASEDEVHDPIGHQRHLRRLADLVGFDKDDEKEQESESGEEEETRKESKGRKSVAFAVEKDKEDEEEALKAAALLETGPKSLQVATLRIGATFGDVALHTGEARTATATVKEDTYLASLTRHDYKAILQSAFEKQHTDRQNFLSRLPLLQGMMPSSFNKIAAMLQPKTLRKDQCVYDWDAPVLQVYFAKEGEFALCYRTQMQDKEEIKVEMTRSKTRGSLTTSATEESLLQRRLGVITVSLLTAPCVVGLTAYMMGEKRYRNRVVCKSLTGIVYCILAKEIALHLSRSVRERISASARAEEMWVTNRLEVLKQLHAPLDRRCGSKYGRRRVKPEVTVDERLALARGDAQPDLSAYSFPGRLRTIGKVFAQPANQVVVAPKAVDNQPGKQKEDTQEGVVADDSHPAPIDNPINRATWRMETLVAANPDTIHPRYSNLLNAAIPEVRDEAVATVPVYVPPILTNYGAFARACWKSERLALASDANCFHTPALDRQVRGRADGSASTTERRAPMNLQDAAEGAGKSHLPSQFKASSPLPAGMGLTVRVSATASVCPLDAPETASPRNANIGPSETSSSTSLHALALQKSKGSTATLGATSSTTSLFAATLQKSKGSTATLVSCATTASRHGPEWADLSRDSSAIIICPNPVFDPLIGGAAEIENQKIAMLANGYPAKNAQGKVLDGTHPDALQLPSLTGPSSSLNIYRRSPSPQDFAIGTVTFSVELPRLPAIASQTMRDLGSSVASLGFFANHLVTSAMQLDSSILAPLVDEIARQRYRNNAKITSRADRAQAQLEDEREQADLILLPSMDLNVVYNTSYNSTGYPWKAPVSPTKRRPLRQRPQLKRIEAPHLLD